jgi:hypothetical protein
MVAHSSLEKPTFLLSLGEGGLDRVDALVGEAGHFDVGADLHGLRGQAALDVRQQVVLCSHQVTQ